MEKLRGVIVVSRLTVKTSTGMANGGIKYLPKTADEIFDVLNKLGEYEDLEEQGLLLKLPISIESAVDKLFSHNEIISLWREEKENGVSCHKRIWYGMAWDIPKELKSCKFVKIFGTIPESIAHADIVNIEVVLSAEAEKALAEMEK